MTTTRPATTPQQKLAEELAFAYRGFMRGCDKNDDFDKWYYGEKLLAAQQALDFEMVSSVLIRQVAALADRRLNTTHASPLGVTLEDVCFV